MKKIILTAGLIFTITVITNAQNVDAVHASNAVLGPANQLNKAYRSYFEDSILKNSDYDFYMAKSSNKKTAAWIFLGGGSLCTAIGVLTFPKDYGLWGNSSSTEKQAEFSSTITIIGIAAMLSSIPFFVSSGINKRKAKASISNKTTLGIPGKGDKLITGLSLSIPIGK